MDEVPGLTIYKGSDIRWYKQNSSDIARVMGLVKVLSIRSALAQFFFAVLAQLWM